MVEAFSAGYYLLRLYVEPHEGGGAVMNSTAHSDLVEAVYPDRGEDDPQPLVVKLDESHLPVLPAESVPSGTLAVPESTMVETRITSPPALREVMLAKADRASQLIGLLEPGVSGWSPS